MAKIKADDYVDFRDILAKGPKSFTATAPLKVGDDSTIGYVELPKGPLSMGQWNLAFDRYADAYADIFPRAAPDLRLYGMLIRSLMMNHPSIWAQYDEDFRQKRKAYQLPYCSYDQGLLAKVRLHQPDLLGQGSLRGTTKGGRGAAGKQNAKPPAHLKI